MLPTMLSLKKDSTISSKASEYDNVPVLPADYNIWRIKDTRQEDPLAHLDHSPSFATDDPTLSSSSSPVAEHCAAPSQMQQFQPDEINMGFSTGKTRQGQHKNPNDSLDNGTGLHQGRHKSPSRQRPFPTQETDLGMMSRSMQSSQPSQTTQQPLPQQNEGLRNNRFPVLECHLKRVDQPALQCVCGRGQQPGSFRSRRESYGEMSTASSMLFYLLVFVVEILLFGVECLVLFWVVYYRKGFAWREDTKREFNYHPVLMITGFVFFMGHAMLVYRVFRCCNKVTAKIFHTFLYLMAVPCIIVATIAVFDSHNLQSPPIPNLYSLHSWLGLITLALFTLQLVVGFFSFWLLLCCEQGTASFRSGLLPVHATFGIVTFMLAIATAVTGYTEKAIFSLRDTYSELPGEAWLINAQAMCLAGLAVLLGFLLYSSRYARSKHPVAIVDPPSSSHYVMTHKSYYYRDNA